MIAAQIRGALHKAAKLGRLLIEPAYRRGLWHGVAAAMEHDAILARLEAATVLDVGANCGQFTLAARRRFPAARILSFEPLADARSVFSRLFAADSRIELFAMALGATDGEATLHRSRRHNSSSLLPIGPLQTTTFPGTEEIGRESVKVARLERLFDGLAPTRPILCKIDVQGGELEVLKGFGSAMASIDAIMIELSFVAFYTGQPLFAALDAHLRGAGFILDCIYGASVDRDGVVLQCNALYRARMAPESAA